MHIFGVILEKQRQVMFFATKKNVFWENFRFVHSEPKNIEMSNMKTVSKPFFIMNQMIAQNDECK